MTDSKETPALVSQNAEDDDKVSKVAEQGEELTLLKTDDGSTTEQQLDVKIEQSEEKPKTGKQSLLDLLGAMKVEVTNKRKLKHMKVKQNYESAPESNAAAMESTISMFKKASVEASSQR